jgi:hypothetical protein
VNPLKIISEIKSEVGHTLTNPLFYWTLLAALPLSFIIRYNSGDWKPRRSGHTIYEHVEKEAYKITKGETFDLDDTVEGHLEKLLDNKANFDKLRKDVWENTQYWYRTKSSGDDDGLGMLPYEDIVKGFPGSCTEGSFISYAAMSQIRKVPGTGDKLDHYILLITYEKSDWSVTAGHCLYVGKITKENGENKFFCGGINPFENPSVEYDSLAELVEENTNLFRYYAYEQLLERGVLIRPQKMCLIDPRILGINITSYSRNILNAKAKDKDARDSIPEHIQRAFMNYFDENGLDYVEPVSGENK